MALEGGKELFSMSLALKGKDYPIGYQVDLGGKDTEGNDEVYWTSTNTPLDYGFVNGWALKSINHDGDCLIFVVKDMSVTLSMSHCSGHETDFVCELPVS